LIAPSPTPYWARDGDEEGASGSGRRAIMASAADDFNAIAATPAADATTTTTEYVC